MPAAWAKYGTSGQSAGLWQSSDPLGLKWYRFTKYLPFGCTTWGTEFLLTAHTLLGQLLHSLVASSCSSVGVDLCNTMIEEIPEFTFGHCTSLREVFLPTTLHTIRVKAFMGCAALAELAIPPALKYIGSRAFLDCTALRRLVKMPGTRRWRGVYAEENAFAICPAMKWPPWLHMIPDMGYTPGLG